MGMQPTRDAGRARRVAWPRRSPRSRRWQRRFAAAAAPSVRSRLVSVDVYDRDDGTALPVYQKDGRRYIVGAPGHEYAVRIRNCTGARVLVVTSVDGVNVISGETAAPVAIGLRARARAAVVEIAGWRKSLIAHGGVLLHRPRRLLRGAHGPAAERGRDRRGGVSRRRRRRRSWRKRPDRLASRDATIRATRRRRGCAAGAAEGGAPAAPQRMPRRTARGAAAKPLRIAGPAASADALDVAGQARHRPRPQRGVARHASTFERATRIAAETVAIQYDRRENLVAMGVIPRTAATRSAQPNPFPGDALRAGSATEGCNGGCGSADGYSHTARAMARRASRRIRRARRRASPLHS